MYHPNECFTPYTAGNILWIHTVATNGIIITPPFDTDSTKCYFICDNWPSTSMPHTIVSQSTAQHLKKVQLLNYNWNISFKSADDEMAKDILQFTSWLTLKNKLSGKFLSQSHRVVISKILQYAALYKVHIIHDRLLTVGLYELIDQDNKMIKHTIFIRVIFVQFILHHSQCYTATSLAEQRSWTWKTTFLSEEKNVCSLFVLKQQHVTFLSRIFLYMVKYENETNFTDQNDRNLKMLS